MAFPRITEGELQQNGWRHYFNSEFVDYCPHMKSWIWSTYLWLYAQTGFDPLLERARTGLRMMMAAYPNWRLEANRVEQERCRMLLPLAWLVRVEDTPEHRQWLDTVARYVIDLQDASGAIPQIPGTVVASNEGYGTGECAIVHQAGDPATDLLYSINFAFIGMHEAAAVTGNPATPGPRIGWRTFSSAPRPKRTTSGTRRHVVPQLRFSQVGLLGLRRRLGLGRLDQRDRLDP